MSDDEDCLFCRIVAGALPADVVETGETVLAFRDVDPQAPAHVLVVPRRHVADVGTLATTDPGVLADLVAMAERVARRECGGQYRLVFNTGPRAGQSVPHVHGHVLGGRAMRWPPG